MPNQVVLVEEPTIFHRRSPDYAGALFNRTYPVIPTQPFYALRQSPPPWTFFQDPFTSVYAVVEAYPTAAVTPQANPLVTFQRPSRRLEEPEDEYKRTDHARAFYQFMRRYAAQLVGYTFTVPDFCDDPWLEWVHPKKSDESAIYPFRQINVFIRGQQFNLFFNQPKPWYVDSEQDSVNRKPDVGMLIPYARPVVQLFMPNLIGLDLNTALVVAAQNFLVITNLDFQDTIYPILPLPKGTVIAQSPLPGVQINIDQPTIIICSSGLMNLPKVGDSVANPVNVVIGPNTLN